MIVILQTASGDYITEGFIPPFMTHPEVILWGTRVFKFYTKTDKIINDHEELMYREVFAWYLIESGVKR